MPRKAWMENVRNASLAAHGAIEKYLREHDIEIPKDFENAFYDELWDALEEEFNYPDYRHHM